MACKFGVDTVETVRGMGRGRVSIVGAKNRYDIVGNDIGFATSTKVVKKEEKKKRKGKKKKEEGDAGLAKANESRCRCYFNDDKRLSALPL